MTLLHGLCWYVCVLLTLQTYLSVSGWLLVMVEILGFVAVLFVGLCSHFPEVFVLERALSPLGCSLVMLEILGCVVHILV